MASNQPWTKIQIVDALPVLAYINVENRIGPICFKLQGKVPKDLAIYISENYTTVTEENARWTFKRKTSFTIFPSEQRLVKPVSYNSKAKFGVLNLLFKTNAQDAQMGVQLTLPYEE